MSKIWINPSIKKDKSILHVMISSKFLPPFIDFVDAQFGRSNHRYIFLGKENYRDGLTPEHKVEFLSTHDGIFATLLDDMRNADKVIIHGLWSVEIDILLSLNPDIAKKSYWIMWGGDFYFPERQTELRKRAIHNVGNVITGILGDYELIKEWYGSTATLYSCFAYPSNVVKIRDCPPSSTKRVLVGNSANPSNNHIEVFEKIKHLEDIEVICPLSYGGEESAKHIIQAGKSIFGNRFIPILEFMPLEDYNNMLASVDLAIFNHNRQQGLGNILTLLGYGKKVYIRDDITSWRFFSQKNIKVFSFNKDKIDFNFSEDVKNKNKYIMKDQFSTDKLIQDWSKIFH